MKATTKASLWFKPQAMLVIILLGIIIISVARDCKKQAPLRGEVASLRSKLKQSYEVVQQEIPSARRAREKSFRLSAKRIETNDVPSFELATGEFESATHQNRQRFKVQRVVDGDTVVLTTGEKLRYIGVDTPETKHPRKPVEYFGKEASAFNKKLVNGKVILVEFDVTPKDRYGRLLGYVFLPDGTFVNAELVKQGYANVYTYPPNVKYSELFRSLQAEAVKQRRGLWNKGE